MSRSTRSSYRRTFCSTRVRSTTTLAHHLSNDEVDFSRVRTVNQEFLATRSSEKLELQELNNRFASFIEKVHCLEQQNASLRQELSRLRSKQQPGQPSRASQLHQQEMRELRRQVEQVSKEKDQVQIERDNLVSDLNSLQLSLDEEIKRRKEAEKEQVLLQKDVDDATVARMELERRIASLTEEIELMKKMHDEEIKDLQDSIGTQKTEVEAMARPDLTAALREIRAQFESIATKNMHESEEWHKSKLADLSESAKRSAEALRQAKRESGEFRRQIQGLNRESRELKSTNEALVKQMREMVNHHDTEVGTYQNTIANLEEDIHNLKDEMCRHLRDHQNLLRVKMALDLEIAAYRRLLDGEEGRIEVPSNAPGDQRNGEPDEPTDGLYKEIPAEGSNEEEEIDDKPKQALQDVLKNLFDESTDEEGNQGQIQGRLNLQVPSVGLLVSDEESYYD